MEQKVAQFKIRGMSRDINNADISQPGKDSNVHTHAYENMNMRITTIDGNNDTLALCNEKGTLQVNKINGLVDGIEGIPIGQNILNDELTLFTTSTLEQPLNINWSLVNTSINSSTATINTLARQNVDRIYKLWFNNDVLNGTVLYKGNLNFNVNKPIDTISFYENDTIKKVYWTDNLNQGRVINIAAAHSVRDTWNNDKFDFVRKLKFEEEVTITKDNLSQGLFEAGTIQYCFTYFDTYHQESNIFYTSPTYYTSHKDRGTVANDTSSNCFNITIKNVDTTFDYVRIYSIQRNAFKGEPVCHIVADLSINDDEVTPTPLGQSYTFTFPYEDLKFMYSNSRTIYDITTWPTAADVQVTSNNVSHTVTYDFRNNSGTAHLQVLIFGDNRIVFHDGDLITLYCNLLTQEITVTITNVFWHNHQVHPSMTGYIRGNKTMYYKDNGLNRISIDPTQLLYVGGEPILFNTFDQKDNTLFLGNISLRRPSVSKFRTTNGKTLSEKIRNGIDGLYFVADKEIPLWDNKGFYNYNSHLQYNSSQITTFKYLEWYRFGIQFLHESGKWSEPLWIGDKYNDVHIDAPYINAYSPTKLITAKLNISDILSQSDITNLNNAGYVKVRPVIVYPTLNDREVLCQGYLCPTVYNYEDRYNGNCYAQSSWFARPISTMPLTLTSLIPNHDNKDLIQSDGFYSPFSNNPSKYISAYTTFDQELPLNRDTTFYGRPIEFRHNYPIPGNMSMSAELQCIGYNRNPIVPKTNSNSDNSNFINKFNSWYAVDQSIVTMHSPDIEFDDIIKSNKIDLTKYKMRIIGLVPLTSSQGDIQIITDTLGHVKKHPSMSLSTDTNITNPIYYPNISALNISKYGGRILGAGAHIMELIYTNTSDTHAEDWHLKGFITYPWHRNGSLINQGSDNTDDGVMLKLGQKKLSNLRYSYNTYYLQSPWNAEDERYSSNQGLVDIQLFNSDQNTVLKLKVFDGEGIVDTIYRGNIDKIQTVNTPYAIALSNTYLNPTQGISGNLENKEYIYQGWFNYLTTNSTLSNDNLKGNVYSKDPIRITYKSTPHFVMSFNSTKNNQSFLPALVTDTTNWNSHDTTFNTTYIDFTQDRLITTPNIVGFNQGVIVDEYFNLTENPPSLEDLLTGNLQQWQLHRVHDFLWLAELYNPNVINRFGGTSEEALELNHWEVGGNTISLNLSSTLEWSEGDTYYQRYDNLKTYPYTLEDQNSIVDIISFMCETHINIDGRTDRNRGQKNNLVMTPNNFNLYNTAYNQKSDFFENTYLNQNKLNLDHFKNTITWTKTKQAGDLIDTWTNITLASTLGMDGDRGEVTSIKAFNNYLYVLQHKGISILNYNNNVAINTVNSTPIELINSGKVTGKQYLSKNAGCINKWSVCAGQRGLYFIDDLNKDILACTSEGIVNLSDREGFKSFINENSSVDSWNPSDFCNFIVYREQKNSDILFINNKYCLAFNEDLGAFTSFYNYEKTPYLASLYNKTLLVNNTNGADGKYYPWLYEEGEYSNFFNEEKPYYTEFVVNDIPSKTKIFDTVEFVADGFDEGDYVPLYSFNNLYAYNEYQENDISLVDNLHRPSNLKKKFRMWKAIIPRNRGTRDRMQNPWLKIRLSHLPSTDKKAIKHLLYDTNVYYYI